MRPMVGVYKLAFLSLLTLSWQINGFLGSSLFLLSSSELIIHKQDTFNTWHGLVPLRSTRENVERLLGGAKSSSGPDYIYDTITDKIIVRYSYATCGRSSDADWNVPIDTVLTITVTPKAKILLRDLHLDLRRFARSALAHPKGFVHYIDREDGIEIESRLLNASESVMNVTYGPSKKDEEMRCQKP